MSTPDYGTHTVALIHALDLTTGPILELGAGDNSTPLLHHWGEHFDRQVVTVETNPDYLGAFRLAGYETPGHVFASSIAEDGWGFAWGCVLIDGPNLERAACIRRLTKARIMVIHDTEDRPDMADLPNALRLVPYQVTYSREKPWTTLASWVGPIGVSA